MNRSNNNKSYILHNNPFFFSAQDRPRTTGNRHSVTQGTAGQRIQKASNSPQNLPKNNLIEKEQLYEENIKLKSNLNMLKDELQFVRIRNVQMEKELSKFEQLIEDRYKCVENGIVFKSNSLMFKLKQKQKQQQSDLLDKVRELDNIKKSIRSTRLQETEVELDEYKKECIRLRQQLNQGIRAMDIQKRYQNSISRFLLEGSGSLEEQYILQGQTLKSLTKDNLHFSNNNRDLQIAVQQQKINIEGLENNIATKENEINKLKRLINEFQKQHHLYRQNVMNKNHKNSIFSDSQKQSETQKKHSKEIAQMDRENTANLEDKNSEIDQLSQLLKQRTKQVEQLDKQFYDLTHKDRQEVTAAQQRELYEKVTRKSSAMDLNLNVDDISQKQSPHEKTIASVEAQKQGKKENLHPKIIHSNSFYFADKMEHLVEKSVDSVLLKDTSVIHQPSKFVQQKKKFQKVNFFDVQNLGYKVRVELQIQQIPFDAVENNFDFEGDLSIADVKDILQGDPFNIKNELESLLIARYLVEDNREDFIQYDENLTNDIEIIKSVFKKLIGRYDLFSEQETVQIRKDLFQMYNKFGTSLIEAINAFVQKKKNLPQGTCEMSDLEAAFKFCDAQVGQRQTEYLKMIIFKMSNDLNRVHYVQLRQEFLVDK